MGEDTDRPEPESGVGWLPDLLEHARKVVKDKGVKERVKVDSEKDLAFLVYSSGTTGLPKGVMLSHSNVVSNLFMVHSSEGTIMHWKRDKVLSVLPYYHIYGMSFPLTSIYNSLSALSVLFFGVPKTNKNRTSMPRPCSRICWHYNTCHVFLRPQALLQPHPRPQNNIHICCAASGPSSRQESNSR